MKNYFENLQIRVDRYKNKYAFRPRRAALSLAFWNFKCVFTCKYLCKIFKKVKQSVQIIDGENKRIALLLNGGLGDYLTAVNYALYLYQYLEKSAKIDLFVTGSKNIKMLFGTSVDFDFYDRELFSEAENYLVKIKLNRFPQVIAYDEQNIDMRIPKFRTLLNIYLELENNCKMYFDLDPRADYLAVQYARINGTKKRIQQPDIRGILGIGENHSYILETEDFGNICQKFQLTKKYITLNRGTDTGNSFSEVTRMWSLENYNELTRLLKQHYPDYQIVQLGYSKEWCKKIDHCDLDLRGETNLSELKTILKYATLHVDYEGGMVHLRKCLRGGPSVVLFGPTDPSWIGYDNNINIYTCRCQGCENLNANWQKKCSNLLNPHICMKSITPEMVMNKITEFFNKGH